MPTRRNRLPLIIAVVVLLVALGAIFYHKRVEEHLFPKNFGVVVPGEVYRSGELSERMLRRVIEEQGIRTVVDFGAWGEGASEDLREQAVADELNVQRYVMRLQGDAHGDPNHYVAALKIMTNPEKQPVLVHCAAGAQRTGAAIVLYRRVVDGWPYERAYEEAGEYKHRAGRDWRLLTYLAEWADDIERAYETGERIPYTE